MTNLDDFHKLIQNNLEEIKEQIKISNGRLKNLELWRSFMIGGISVLTLLVVPILLYLVTL